MQNVQFASSLCSSKLLVVGSSILLLVVKLLLLLVIGSSYYWFAIPLSPSLNSSCSQLTVPCVLGLQLLLLLAKAPFAPSLQLLLLLVYSSSWSQLELLLLLVGSSSCSQLAIPLTLGWQLFSLLVSGSFWSLSNSSCSWSVVFVIMVKVPFAPGSQLLLLLVYSSFQFWLELFLVLVGSSSYS